MLEKRLRYLESYQPHQAKNYLVMRRRQFLLEFCYAMTLSTRVKDKLQLQQVYSYQDLFQSWTVVYCSIESHLSQWLMISALEDDEDYKGWTKNIVYKEVLTSLNRSKETYQKLLITNFKGIPSNFSLSFIPQVAMRKQMFKSKLFSLTMTLFATQRKGTQQPRSCVNFQNGFFE